MATFSFTENKLSTLINKWNFDPAKKFQLYTNLKYSDLQIKKFLDKEIYTWEANLIFKEINKFTYLFDCEFLINCNPLNNLLQNISDLNFKINSSTIKLPLPTPLIKPPFNSSLPKMLIVSINNDEIYNYDFFEKNITPPQYTQADLLIVDSNLSLSNKFKSFKNVYSLNFKHDYNIKNKLDYKIYQSNIINKIFCQGINFYDYIGIINPPFDNCSYKAKINNFYETLKEDKNVISLFDGDLNQFSLINTFNLKKIIPIFTGFNNPLNNFYIKKWQDVFFEKSQNLNLKNIQTEN